MITLAESKVLDNIKHGFTVKESAKLLSVSHETVKSHKASLMVKLDARNSAHLVYLAMSRGLISIIAMLMSISAMGQADTTYHWLIPEDAEPITNGGVINVVQYQQPCDIVGCAVYHGYDTIIEELNYFFAPLTDTLTGHLEGDYYAPSFYIYDAYADSAAFYTSCDTNDITVEYRPDVFGYTYPFNGFNDKARVRSSQNPSIDSVRWYLGVMDLMTGLDELLQVKSNTHYTIETHYDNGCSIAQDWIYFQSDSIYLDKYRDTVFIRSNKVIQDVKYRVNPSFTSTWAIAQGGSFGPDFFNPSCDNAYYTEVTCNDTVFVTQVYQGTDYNRTQ